MLMKRTQSKPVPPAKPVKAGPCKCGGQIIRTLLTSYRAVTRAGTVPVDVVGWTCTKGGDACVERRGA